MCWKRSLAISIVSAALLAACGGDEPAVSTGDPTPAAQFALTHPVIAEPANGDTVKADRERDDELIATVLVRGSAEPDTRVVVSTGCEADACRAPVRTAQDGAFAAEVRLTAAAQQPRATIIVGYADQGASVDSDRVIVTVKPSAAADLPTEDNTTNSTRKRPKRARTPAPLPTSEPPSATAPPSSTSAPSTGRTTTNARNLLVIGDSLAVGMRPYLQQFLPGWNITVDARTGRPLAEGMSRFDATPAPSDDTVYAFSLFTNDDPSSVGALESAVKRSNSKGCAVWSTIVRPPVGGTSYAAANTRLNALASARIRIAQWADQVARNPDWIAGDGVHATPEGYRNRAALYAAAAKTCTD